MSSPLYLSVARLSRDASAAALRPLLAPSDESTRVSTGHRLVWTLFADTPDRTRDFLWREAEPGVFYLLSRRLPRDAHGLFELQEPKAFAPELTEGDRLRFTLRANATVARATGSGRRGKPCDVVMNALHGIPRGARAAERTRLLEPAGLGWLSKQGERNGFAPDAVRVMGYRTIRLDRGKDTGKLGVLDFEGTIEVREPATFVEAVANGFGRAKAFGCGLMLIRRA